MRMYHDHGISSYWLIQGAFIDEWQNIITKEGASEYFFKLQEAPHFKTELDAIDHLSGMDNTQTQIYRLIWGSIDNVPKDYVFDYKLFVDQTDFNIPYDAHVACTINAH